MEFCDFCSNMLYIRDEETNRYQVQYYCKNCGFNKPISEERKTIPVIRNMYTNENNHARYLNPDLVHDPTIPHVDNIPCPNEACTRAADQTPDVIFMKYDVNQIKFVYMCVHCKTFWRLNDPSSATEPTHPSSSSSSS